MHYRTLLDVVTNRRSIRKFKPGEVSREDIEKIATIGMQAPSAFNAQMWEIVVVDEQPLRDKIANYFIEEMDSFKTAKGFLTAPVFLMVYGDERTRSYGPAVKQDDDAWWQFSLDASLNNAFISMQYAAASLGLGSMWVSAFRNPEIDRRTRKLLNIPAHLKLYEMMAIGYSDIKVGKKKLRELSDTVHFNGVDNYRTSEELDNWFKAKK